MQIDGLLSARHRFIELPTAASHQDFGGRQDRPQPVHLIRLAQHVHRHGEHDRRRLVAGDLREGLQVAKLHRFALLGEHLGGGEQLLGGLQLALGVDHLGAPLALGLRLARDRPDHRLVDVDMLDLDVRHLDAPGVGLVVEHRLDVLVQLLALGEELVELVLAEDRAQRGLRELARRLVEIRHLDDGELRIDDAEVDHRVHLH